MTYPILVLTSTQGFGELIEQTLNDTGLYRVVLVDNASTALRVAKSLPFVCSILDEECHPGMADLIVKLRDLIPAIGVIVIPLDLQPCQEVTELGVQGMLSKPFYLPDLLEIVHHVVKNRTAPKEAVHRIEDSPLQAASNGAPLPTAGAIDWLQDPSRAAQHLTSLSLETSALAALIVRDRKLWSYAGQLPQPASQELTMMIANYWSQGIVLPPGSKLEGKSDLARFIRLESTGGEYMLYATELANEMVLALVFEVETPFGQIRAQASRLARALSLPLVAEAPPSDKSPKPETSEPASSGNLKTLSGAAPAAPSVGTEVPPSSVDSSEPVEEEEFPVALPPLWDDVPPSNPTRSGQDHAPLFSPSAPAVPLSEQLPEGTIKPAKMVEISPVAKMDPAPVQQETPAAIPTTATSPTLPVLQPITPAVYQLTCAYLIIPRMTRHCLAGDLAEKLAAWMGELCMAFDWKLEYMVIQPNFMHWIVNVPPATSPGYLIRVIRQQTSKRIFDHFPDLARENPSGDYWAPGYLVMSSAQPLSDQIIQDFIGQVRQHQGASKSPNSSSRGR